MFTGRKGWSKNLGGGGAVGKEEKSLCPMTQFRFGSPYTRTLWREGDQRRAGSAAQEEQVLKPFLAEWSWVVELVPEEIKEDKSGS